MKRKELKKKIKDFTLEEISNICVNSKEIGGCNHCPFFHEYYFYTWVDDEATPFCPFNVRMDEIGDLKEKEIKVEILENE